MRIQFSNKQGLEKQRKLKLEADEVTIDVDGVVDVLLHRDLGQSDNAEGVGTTESSQLRLRPSVNSQFT